MPFFIEIDHKNKLIRNTYEGIITKADLANVWRHLLSLEEFKSLKYNLLSDYRNSNFDIPQSERDGLLNFLISVKDILKGKKEAAIVINPKDTALSLLLQIKVDEKIDYIVRLFSTIDTAIDWLTINDTN